MQSRTNTEEDFAWVDYRRRFADVYDQSNYSGGLQAATMHASHRLVEKAFDARHSYNTVLEIGAGTGEHHPYVRHHFDRYVMTDSDPKALAIAEKKISPAMRDRFEFEVQRGEHLEYPDDSVDRIVATHVLEHIYQPHLAIKEWARVVRNGGTLSILIPTDPGLAWRLGRRLGPRRNALALGIAYDYVMAREHVNPCNNLIALLRHYFPKRVEGWWPLPIGSIDINLFFAFHAKVEKLDSRKS